MKPIFPAIIAAVLGISLSLPGHADHHGRETRQSHTDSVAPDEARLLTLTEQDYAEVARELGVETAAIKAVVEIEAGRAHQGFSEPGKPIVNFDLSMFRRSANKRGINLTRYYKSHPQVFSRCGRSSQSVVWNRLQKARAIDNVAAVEGTFWGMFQIGGFNWRKCGCSSIDEFVELMSRSERDQLELFAGFIKSSGLLKALQNKNWSSFAAGYNGPSYARRGYHTRMAAAYSRHRSKEQAAATAHTVSGDEISGAITSKESAPKTSRQQRKRTR